MSSMQLLLSRHHMRMVASKQSVVQQQHQPKLLLKLLLLSPTSRTSNPVLPKYRSQWCFFSSSTFHRFCCSSSLSPIQSTSKPSVATDMIISSQSTKGTLMFVPERQRDSLIMFIQDSSFQGKWNFTAVSIGRPSLLSCRDGNGTRNANGMIRCSSKEKTATTRWQKIITRMASHVSSSSMSDDDPPRSNDISTMHGSDSTRSRTNSGDETTQTKKLLDYQKDGVKFLKSKERAILGDEMGLGKTIQCIQALNELGQEHIQKQEHTAIHPSLKQKPLSVLIISPKSVLSVWENEIAKWMDIPYEIENMSETNKKEIRTKKATKTTIDDATIPPQMSVDNISVSIKLINYDLFCTEKYRNKFSHQDVLICDEAHKLKETRAKRTLAILGNGSKKCPGISSQYLWLLTGTPMLNRPAELYPLLRAVFTTSNNKRDRKIPDELKSFSAYAFKFCDGELIKIYTKNGVRMIFSAKGISNEDELQTLTNSVMLRRCKNVALAELPPKTHKVKILSDISSSNIGYHEKRRLVEVMKEMIQDYKQKKKHGTTKKKTLNKGQLFSTSRKGKKTGVNGSYFIDVTQSSQDATLAEFAANSASNIITYIRRHLKDFLGDTELDNDLEYIDMDCILGATARVRSETSMLKIGPAIALLENMLLSKEEEKVVVFAHHRVLIENLMEHFGSSRAVCVYGGMSNQERQEAVDRFQNDPSISVFVGGLMAAGTGLTLTAACRVVFLELDWSPGIMTQAEDRCHRVGQYNTVQVEYYTFKYTIDEWLANVLVNKSEWIERIVGPQLNADISDYSSGDMFEEEKIETVEKYSETSPQTNLAKQRRYHGDYIMNFGEYKGHALDDVPAEYIQYLVHREVYRRHHFLWRALYNRGLVTMNTPPYKFDFGKFKDFQIDDVPKPYLEYLVKQQAYENRTELSLALVDKGLISMGQLLSLSQSVAAPEKNNSTDIPADKQYFLDFGKYKGCSLEEVPDRYLDFLVEEKIWSQRHTLRQALVRRGKIADETKIS